MGRHAVLTTNCSNKDKASQALMEKWHSFEQAVNVRNKPLESNATPTPMELILANVCQAQTTVGLPDDTPGKHRRDEGDFEEAHYRNIIDSLKSQTGKIREEVRRLPELLDQMTKAEQFEDSLQFANEIFAVTRVIYANLYWMRETGLSFYGVSREQLTGAFLPDVFEQSVKLMVLRNGFSNAVADYLLASAQAPELSRQ